MQSLTDIFLHAWIPSNLLDCRLQPCWFRACTAHCWHEKWLRDVCAHHADHMNHVIINQRSESTIKKKRLTETMYRQLMHFCFTANSASQIQTERIISVWWWLHDNKHTKFKAEVIPETEFLLGQNSTYGGIFFLDICIHLGFVLPLKLFGFRNRFLISRV